MSSLNRKTLWELVYLTQKRPGTAMLGRLLLRNLTRGVLQRLIRRVRRPDQVLSAG